MQPPPHNGMMNMQQPGPQYINQQVKKYYVVLSFIKCYHFSILLDILTRLFIFHNILNTSLLPRSLMCTLLARTHTNTTYLRQCCRQNSRQQVKPTSSHEKAQKKWKIKILNCHINSRHTSEWIKWWKSVRKIVYSFEYGKNIHSLNFECEQRAFVARWCSACWIFLYCSMWYIFRRIQFAIRRLDFPNLWQMCHVDSAISAKDSDSFSSFFSIFNSCRFSISLAHTNFIPFISICLSVKIKLIEIDFNRSLFFPSQLQQAYLDQQQQQQPTPQQQSEMLVFS